MAEKGIRDLSQAHLDGRISDEEFSQLQQRLRADADARREYAQVARLDAELRDIGGDAADLGTDPQTSFVAAKERTAWFVVPTSITALVIAVAILLMSVPMWNQLRRDEQREGAVASADPVRSIAVISAEADARWKTTDSNRPRQGTALMPGNFELERGLAQIDFFSGASMTLSGPAEIELRSSKLAILHRGRVKADVPPAARGFEIRAADVRLEDLGTSFGVAVGTGGEARVVVFDGEVRAIDRGGEVRSLTAGDAARLTGGRTTRAVDEKAESFPDITAVIERSGGRDRSRYASWKVAASERRRDPRLVAYYDFEDLTDSTRRLANRAESGDGSELDGGIVGARVTSGRWPLKKALDFRGEGDRVRFDIPGEFDAITLYAWVRIDALDRPLNSLFLTDHYDPGEFHWQLSGEGILRFSTSPKGAVPDLQTYNRRFFSKKFWHPGRSGQWFLLATTVDRVAGQKENEPVVHYIDGRRVGMGDGHHTDLPLPKMRIGKADLGNWTDPISTLNAIRSLNGRIDEFAIYSVALSPEEIGLIYEQGRP